MTRVALYARTSRPDQEPENQLQPLRRAVEGRPGWQVVKEFVSRGVSGTEARPAALRQLLLDAGRGRFDVVMVWRFDRMSRNVSALLLLLDELGELGIAFRSLQEDIDTSTPTGRAVVAIIGALAQMERDAISERVAAGMDRARREGRHIGRPRVQIDLRPALAMLREGSSLGETAEAMGVNRTTLRRRLVDAGVWADGKLREA